MSQRTESFPVAPCVAILAALVVLSGCGGGQSASPPPRAEAGVKPAENPAPAEPATTGSNSTGEAPAAAAPAAPPPTPTPTAAATPTPAPAMTTTTHEPPPATGTSQPAANPPTSAPAEAKPDKPADPLQWMQEGQSRRADYQKQLAEAEAKVAIANASIADWERTILAFKNPFRPRPQLAPEDAQAIEGKDGAARVSWAEGKLAEATATRDAAQKTLNDLKASPPSN